MVWGFIRYQFSSYLRSLTFIPPLTSYIAWIFLFYTYSGVPIMSSYAVTCISLYLVMTWVAMNVFALELESEKNLLFVQLPSKRDYLWGKWIVCLVIASVLGFLTIVYPLVINSFKETAQVRTCKYSHLWPSVFRHLRYFSRFLLFQYKSGIQEICLVIGGVSHRYFDCARRDY